MGGEVMKKKPKPTQMNPNWIQLQQKLKLNGSKPYSRTFKKSEEDDTSKSILGNTKMLFSHLGMLCLLHIMSGGYKGEALKMMKVSMTWGEFLLFNFLVFIGKRKDRSDDESDDNENNPLAPVNDDSSLTDAVAMDCEMVGVGEGNKSALGRVTLINKWGNVIYDEFVRPLERVVDFRTFVSGIRPRDLRKAKDLWSAQKKVAELIKGRILVGHALHNDLKALLLSHPKKDIRDTSEYQPFLKSGSRRALKHLAEEVLGAKIQSGEHCPIEDARAAMMLYQRNRKEWEKSIKDQVRNKKKQGRRKPKKKPKNEDASNVSQAGYESL